MTYIRRTHQRPLLDLIDTQWNVNSDASKIKTEAQCDLIDTQWNVNIMYSQKFGTGFNDLIDTQWNVNHITRKADSILVKI